jgi:hypothetical protein
MTPAVGAPFYPISVSCVAPPGRLGAHQEIAALVTRLQEAFCAQNALSGDESLVMRARITPLDEQGRPREPRDVRLRLLDDRGLAFEHPAPLADRRAWVSVESPTLGVIAAEIELSWCRYNEGGRYTSGGRFVQFVSPLDAPPE